MSSTTPAPQITVDRGPITLTMVPVSDPDRPGWEIKGTIRQSNVNAPWTINVFLQLVSPPDVDNEDEVTTYNLTYTKAINECPTEADALASMQATVNDVWANHLPTPAAPPAGP